MQDDGKVKQLRQSHEVILQKLAHLANIESQYDEHFNYRYLGVIGEIMQKINNNLQKAEFKHNNGSKQIKQDRNLVNLAKQLDFYTKEQQVLSRKLETIYGETIKVRGENTKLQLQNQRLKQNLYHDSKKGLHFKYKVALLQRQYVIRSKEKAINLVRRQKQESQMRKVKNKFRMTARTNNQSHSNQRADNKFLSTQFNFYNPQQEYKDLQKAAVHFLNTPNKNLREQKEQKRNNIMTRVRRDKLNNNSMQRQRCQIKDYSIL